MHEDELAAARGFYERALPIYESIGDRLGLANTLIALGDLSVHEDELAAARGFYERALPIYESIGARLGLANTLKALGDLDQTQQNWAEALVKYDQATTIFSNIGDSYSIAITKRRMWPTLVALNRTEDAVRGVLFAREVYSRIGLHHYVPYAENSLKELRNQIGAEAFAAAWLAVTGSSQQPDWLAGAGEGESGAPAAPAGAGQNTLPAESVNMLAGNTAAVLTGVPDKRDEWRGQVQGLRDDFAGRGADYVIEVAFADALLALLDGAEDAALPDDNPYAGVVRQVVAAVGQHRTMQMLRQMYADGGAEAVRAALAGAGVPEETIAAALADLAGAEDEG